MSEEPRFNDPDKERRSTGPWYERLATGAVLTAQVFDHDDGSCTVQINDGRWHTADGYPKLCASKWFADRAGVDLDAEVRAMGYEPLSESWEFTGHATWFDPEDWDGEPTESYGVGVRAL
ncbi:hypothetical protein [Streptomyces katsurahamanus]|uniref:Uncharacterized protein n=1 Tax=Streptomyces katsurahamanus TaxID=2577098 RepID=A0ABW9P1W4_9ACTN|nr:hypothetical protein [Streptomyces katsurahamanus]MQS39591.1 hypothetical protein [Streptomyces katsurahamanus]